MGKQYLNGVVYAGFHGSYHIHSTSEHIVGKWVDGSTLYEKTKILDFSDLTQDGIQYYVAIGESGENVKKVEGYAKSDDYGICILGSRNYETNNHANDYYWEFAQYGNNVSLIFAGYNASDIDVSEIVITYQYTKT